MEKRRLLRIPTYIEADIFSGGNSYAAFIGNLTESGVYVETAPTNTPIDFIPGTTLELEFQNPSGEALYLHCEVNWLYTQKNPRQGLVNRMGMEIKDPPLRYKEFIKSLH